MVKKKTKYTHVSEVMYIITKTYYIRNDCILDLRYCSVHNRFKSLSVKTTKLKRASKMICIGNHMISSAIWDKSARVNFSKANQIARARRASAICSL